MPVCSLNRNDLTIACTSTSIQKTAVLFCANLSSLNEMKSPTKVILLANKSLWHNCTRYIQCINSLGYVNENLLKILIDNKDPSNIKISLFFGPVVLGTLIQERPAMFVFLTSGSKSSMLKICAHLPKLFILPTLMLSF